MWGQAGTGLQLTTRPTVMAARIFFSRLTSRNVPIYIVGHHLYHTEISLSSRGSLTYKGHSLPPRSYLLLMCSVYSSHDEVFEARVKKGLFFTVRMGRNSDATLCIFP